MIIPLQYVLSVTVNDSAKRDFLRDRMHQFSTEVMSGNELYTVSNIENILLLSKHIHRVCFRSRCNSNL